MERSHLIGDCWIWPEGKAIRWFTPAETGLFESTHPGNSDFPVQLKELRDQETEVPIDQGLNPHLAALLGDLLEKHPSGLRLHLSEDLQQDWHRFPYQWLHFRGKSLHGHLLVIFHASKKPEQETASCHQGAAILDLWLHKPLEMETGGNEPFRALAIPGFVQVYRGFGPVAAFLRQKDLSEYVLTCVIAHGSETMDAPPFRLPGGALWTLPSDECLSPVVLLLVCGNDDHNLIAYGRNLLCAGAQAVLAPVGRIDAVAADAFLRDFLMAWQEDQRLDEILLHAQANDESETCARRLQLLGRGDLRLSQSVLVKDKTDLGAAEAVSMGDTEALTGLINRLTFRCFQDKGNLTGVVEDLFDALEIEHRDQTEEVRLLKVLDDVQERLWPLARAWVLPLAAYLAETYDHAQLEKYEGLHRELSELLPRTPYTQYAWSKLYYRQGQDLAAVEELAAGLKLIPSQRRCAGDAVALLGHFVNVLVDLNLPEAARAVFDLMDPCFSGKGDDLLDRYRTARMNRAGRLSLREGRVEAALSFFRLANTEALCEGCDGNRELSWLLYTSVWAEITGASEWAEQVKEKLRNVSVIFAAFGSGNESEAYLMRALAAWAWRTGDEDAIAILNPYLNEIRERLYLQDAGPCGHTLAFLHLYRKGHPGSALDLPAWDEIQAPMEAQHYWLDLAVFNALCEDWIQSRRCLERFQQLRQELVISLGMVPDWLEMRMGKDWRRNVEGRATLERECLQEGNGAEVQTLAGSGAIPI